MNFKHIFSVTTPIIFLKGLLKIYLFNFCNLGHPNAYYTLMQYTLAVQLCSLPPFWDHVFIKNKSIDLHQEGNFREREINVVEITVFC